MFIWISLHSRMGAWEKPNKGCALLECLGARCTPVKKANSLFLQTEGKGFTLTASCQR